MHNDGLGSSFRREVAQLDRLLSQTEGPPDGLGKISESDSSLSGQPSVSVSGVSSPDSKRRGSPKMNDLEMASLAREYRLEKKPALMSVGVKPGSDARSETFKPGSDPTDKDVPEESWITANRKEPEGWSSMRKDQTAEDARAFAELMNRGWEGLGTEGTRLRDGWPLFRVSAVVCQTLGVIYIVWRACRTYNIEALWLSIPFYMAELVSFLPSFIFCLEASRKALNLSFPLVRRRLIYILVWRDLKSCSSFIFFPVGYQPALIHSPCYFRSWETLPFLVSSSHTLNTATKEVGRFSSSYFVYFLSNESVSFSTLLFF